MTGGYFADPGCKDVDGLARLGFPIAEVPGEGPIVITKVAGSGGRVTAATCKEQLLYEIHDPAAYVTPDMVADFSQVRVTEMAEDRVASRARPDVRGRTASRCRSAIVTGTSAKGRSRTPAPVRSRAAGWRRQSSPSVCAYGCARRGRALRSDRRRFAARSRAVAAGHEPYEVRLRVAARADSLEAARRIGQEVETLYTNGPAGGGGAVAATREVLAVVIDVRAARTGTRQHPCRGRGMKLRDIAHSRTGDKGSTVNISLIAFR